MHLTDIRTRYVIFIDLEICIKYRRKVNFGI